MWIKAYLDCFLSALPINTLQQRFHLSKMEASIQESEHTNSPILVELGSAGTTFVFGMMY